jgi:hypothetical protein
MSFAEFGRLLTGLATGPGTGPAAGGAAGGAGAQGEPPASITVVSGDVHHSYLAAVDLPARLQPHSAVYQAVCSPIHNLLPDQFRRGQRLATSRAGELIGTALARLAGVPKPEIRWRITHGPWRHNMLSMLEFNGRHARIRFERTTPDVGGTARLLPVCETELS